MLLSIRSSAATAVWMRRANDLKCNSKLLLTIIDESLTHDITETMAMLKARLHDDKGRKHTVICTPTSQTFEFSMENDSVFCSSGNDDVTCYVFADGAHPSGVIFQVKLAIFIYLIYFWVQS
ncbi:hypothetical protein L596_015722 [Steinernema carpocapsae]|uniref:Ground-like domain-containing protein n=1 Tax=Steinernema carpocapsae TaxID=34508 RepID=A0A4U5NFV6_STECR|nr:hypothetical protein L596_015722 [Steinernema carpocapsae]